LQRGEGGDEETLYQDCIRSICEPHRDGSRTQTLMCEDTELRCPNCNSEAVYKHGKTKAGKQRFLCLLCKKQFTPQGLRKQLFNRPLCPVCGNKMHLYMRKGITVRFRCSAYPICKTFLKIEMGEMSQ